MGLQNVGKFSHFGMAVLRRGGGGGGLKKKRPLAVLRDKDGNGSCPQERRHSVIPISLAFGEIAHFEGGGGGGGGTP